jgi:outer membrane receptor for ferrienterochelin and colicin
VDQIKKIEIIRGPGSAIYGGFAEYGVVNIITKSGADLNGVAVAGTYGQMENTFARRNLNISAGKKIKDTDISLSAFTGQGNRSDQTYTDIYGSSYNMAGNAKLDPTNINLGISHKGLSFRGIIDKYDMTVQDAYDVIKTYPSGQNFDSYFGELKYVYKAGDKLTITPRFNFKRQQPWASTAEFDSSDAYLRRVDRYRGNLTTSYNISRKINVVAGSEFFNDYAQDKLPGGYFYSRDAHGNKIDSSKTVQYHNYAFFAQGLIKQRLVNIILGARYDYNNAFGSSFVPRVGLTKKINKFNFKLLYSNSFRAPAIENIDKKDSTEIKPEKTNVIELELGYQLTRNSIITANMYDITTKDPIIYYVLYDANNPHGRDAYHNYGKTGSRGIEVEYRVKEKWGYVNLNYSFYTTAGKNLNDSSYMVPDHPNVHLAFPANRINLNSCFYLTKNFSASVSLSFFDTRYGYTDTLGIHTFKPTALLNIFVNYNNLFVKGLILGAGVYDAANEKFQFIQAYHSGHAPLPGPSREFIVKLCYEFKSGAKKK